LELTDEEVHIDLGRRTPWPVCSGCGRRCKSVHSASERIVRHLDVFHRRCFLHFEQSLVQCKYCGVKAESNQLVDPFKRGSKAFRRYVGRLCKMLPLSQVARHVGISECAVKDIDKQYLASNYAAPDFTKLRRLAVDEIAWRKGHKYVTVVLDHDSGEVVWTGEGRSKKSFSRFFKKLGPEICSKITAVSMDMAASYSSTVKEYCPNAQIVFDHFHVTKHLNDMVNETRRETIAQLGYKERRELKGKRFVLLRRFDKLAPDKKASLVKLIEINSNLWAAYIMKELFNCFWEAKNLNDATEVLENWLIMARESELPALHKAAKMIEKHRDGLLAYHVHHLTNGPLEGLNTKINVLRRSRYGFHDVEYFGLKIRQLSIERTGRNYRRINHPVPANP
jgi:transposase